MVGYLRTSGRVAEPFNAPPGYFSLKDAVRMVKARGARGVTARDGKFVDTHQGAIEDLVKAGIMFVGTPDEVGSQIADFNHSVGGLGHLLLMGHAGHLSHADAMDQITLLAREVLPRVQRATEPA
jgi:alkanesulfonate monooxygenase SsuD/methylene tetrahydromethanopterin reductase-like flavin-dependent oxidoreductase (luciferase family)